MLYELEVVSKEFSKKLANMTGFRNILVHDYTRVDPEIIINVLKVDIEDFIKYSGNVNKWLEKKLK